jgi:uncharacterized protein (TIGR03435 family)
LASFLASAIGAQTTPDAPTFEVALVKINRSGSRAPGADPESDSVGPSFEEALREQLGIKLQAQKGPVSVPILDHVERPSVN